MWTVSFQMFKLVLEKAEEPEIKVPASTGVLKKQESCRKKPIYFCFIDYVKDFVWITTNCGKFWKIWEYQTASPASWEIYIQIREQHLELDMEQQFGSVQFSRSVMSDSLRLHESAREASLSITISRSSLKLMSI